MIKHHSFTAVSIHDIPKQSSLFDKKLEELLAQYSINRSLEAIRAKRIMIEDMVERVLCFAEDKKLDVEILGFYARAGIPTAIVFVNNLDTWIEIRQELRRAGLAR